MSRTAVLLACLLPVTAAAQSDAPAPTPDRDVAPTREVDDDASPPTAAPSDDAPESGDAGPPEQGSPEGSAETGPNQEREQVGVEDALDDARAEPIEESPFVPLRRPAPRDATPPAVSDVKEDDPSAAAGDAPAFVERPSDSESVTRAEPAPFPVYGAPGTRFVLRVDGYLRSELACIYPSSFCGIGTPSEDDARRNPYVGRSDWFALGGARVNLRGRYGDDLAVRLALAGEAVRYEDPVDPVGRYDTQVQAAYLSYRLSDALSVHLGRFRPPFDVESLTPLEGLFFVHRSLESRGVLPQEGWASDELGRFSPGRQLGAMLSGQHDLSGGAMRLGYHLAVTNGNSGQRNLNDNDRAAVYGRVTFELPDSSRYVGYHRRDEEGPATVWLEDGLRVGLGGFYNDLTFGEPPNRLNDRALGAGFDVAAKYSYFIFQGQVLFRQVQHLTRGGSADERGFGGHAQLSFDVLGTGIYPGYRFSVLDPREPTAELTPIETADSDQVMHHTVGFKWVSSSLPLMGFFEYTVSLEEEGRELANDRIEAALQVIFE